MKMPVLSQNEENLCERPAPSRFLPASLLRGFLWLSLAWMAASSASAITMTGSDGYGVSSFNSGADWSGGAAPVAGNAYTDTGYTIRTPLDSNSYTFQGDSLTLTGGVLALAGSGVITVNALTLGSGASVQNFAGGTATLAGAITLGTGAISFTPAAVGRTLKITATVGGSGALTIQGITGGDTVILKGTNTYSGGTTVSSGAILDVQSDSGLGTGNVTVASGGQLIFELGSINNYIADTAKLTLASGLASGSITLNFSGTDTIGALSLDGGATYLTAGMTYGAVGSTAEVQNSVFTGSGILYVAAVPEPGALGLAGLGLAWAFLRRRSLFRPGHAG